MDDNPYLSAYRKDKERQRLLEQASRPATAEVAAPLTGGGVLGFLRDTGRSIGASYDRLGKGLANVADEVTGGAQRARDLQFKTQQDDVSTIKALGDRMKSATNDQDKQRIRNSLKKISQIGDSQDATFQQRQNEIIEQNDPIKGGADVASIGLDVLGAGAGSALLKGGLRQAIVRGVKQGALFGGAQGTLQPLKEKGGSATAEDIGGNTLTGLGTGAVLGGVTGGVLKGGEKILGGGSRAIPDGAPVSFMQRVGKKLEQSGGDLMGSQTNLTRSEARKIGAIPADVMGSINRRTGLSSLDDMAEVGNNVTGSDGAFSELTRNAIGNVKGVDISDLRKVGDDLIIDKAPLITGAERKALQESIKNNVVKAYGGSSGSLDTLANPLEALDVSKNFRSIAADIRKGASVSAKDKQLASVYNELAKSIEDRIYASPGINEGLTLAAPDRAKDLLDLASRTPNKSQARAYEKLAKELASVKDVKSLRSLQKDFVDLGNIDRATAQARGGAAAQLGDNMQGLGRLVQKPTNLLAVPLNAATPSVGGLLSKIGRGVQGDAPPAVPLGLKSSVTTAKSVLPAAQMQGILGSVATPGVARSASVAEPEMLQQDTGVNGVEEGIEIPTEDTFLPPASQRSGMFNKENIQDLILQDLQGNEGKNITTLLKLYETFGQEEEPRLSAKQVESKSRAQAGITALDQIEEAFGGAGGGQGFLGNITNIAGSLKLNPEAEAYNRIRNSAISLISRGLGGSAQGSDRDRADIEQALPSLTDSAEAARIKIQALRDRLSAGSLSTSPEEETISQGVF